MAIPAKFEAGMCPAGCGRRIHPGDMICHDDNYGWVHDECTPKPDRSVPPEQITCGVCWCIPCRC